MNTLPTGFSLEPLYVRVEDILPSRLLDQRTTASRKYIQIKASIEEIGLIEPLSIAPFKKGSTERMLLDGHLRLAALVALGEKTAPCLVATDDEGFTYNNRVNRLSTVQEHFMIRKVLERGVSPQRLAKALDVELRMITKSVGLLKGVCPEAIDLLKDRRFAPDVTRILRRMKPVRQVECAELMVSANRFSMTYIEAMLAATPSELLLAGETRRQPRGISAGERDKMELEMANVQRRYRTSEQTYGEDVLNLVIARGYVGKLIENEAVSAYLRGNEPEIFDQFELIVKSVTLD